MSRIASLGGNNKPETLYRIETNAIRQNTIILRIGHAFSRGLITFNNS